MSRTSFISQLSTCRLCIVRGYSMSNAGLDWIALRCMKLDGLCLGGEVSESEKQILTRSCQLDWLNVSTLESVKLVLDLGVSFHVLEMYGYFRDDFPETEFMTLLPQLSLVQALDFNCVELDVEFLLCVCENCQCLKEFRCSCDGTVIIERCGELTSVACLASLEAVNALIDSPNVTKIELVHNYCFTIGDDLAEKIAKTRNLVSFSVFGADLTDASICVLAEHGSQLLCLDLADTQITDVGLIALSHHCCELARLHICSSEITDTGIEAIIDGCSGLTDLQMSSDSLTDCGVLYILRYSRRLQYLNVYSEHLTDLAFSRAFSLCPSLRDLEIERLHFSSHVLVSNVGDVELLDAQDDEYEMRDTLHSTGSRILTTHGVTIGPTAWNLIFLQSPRLMCVSIRFNNDLLDSCIVAMSKSCPNLTKVFLWNCESLTIMSIAALLTTCANLVEINVVGIAESFGCYTPPRVTCASRNLAVLRLNTCDTVDWVLHSVAASCPLLTSLDVQYCNDITSDAVVAVLKSCLRLTSVDVSHCPLMDPAVLLAACDQATRGGLINSLAAYDCPLIQSELMKEYLPVFDKLGVKMSL